MLKKILSYSYFGAFIALLLSVQAAAYLDPSAVTYVVYILAGVAIACGAAISVYWSRIKRAIRKKKKKAAAKKAAKLRAAQGNAAAQNTEQSDKHDSADN